MAGKKSKDKNMITMDEMDEMLEVIDNLPPNVTYDVTVEDLIAHNVEENFKQFAPYLLWVTESIVGSIYIKDKEVNQYVKALFNKYMTT